LKHGKGDKKREYKRHSRAILNRKHIYRGHVIEQRKKRIGDLEADLMMMEKTINQHC
jgi:hypothetical protein